jgi:hypothetical protein
VLLAAVYKSPGSVWNDTDIIKLLSFRHKLLLAGDLNAQHPFWNSAVSNTSAAKLLNLLHINDFEISAPRCSTHYCPAGNGDVLDNFVQKNVRLNHWYLQTRLRSFSSHKTLIFTDATVITLILILSWKLGPFSGDQLFSFPNVQLHVPLTGSCEIEAKKEVAFLLSCRILRSNYWCRLR